LATASPEERAAAAGFGLKDATDTIQNLRQGAAAESRKAKEKQVDPAALKASMEAAGASPDIVQAAMQALATSGERPSGTSVFSAITNPQRQEAGRDFTRAKLDLQQAEKEYRALSGKSGKQGTLTPPSDEEVSMAKQNADAAWEWKIMPGISKPKIVAAQKKVAAWERYSAARDAVNNGGGKDSSPTPEGEPQSRNSIDDLLDALGS